MRLRDFSFHFGGGLRTKQKPFHDEVCVEFTNLAVYFISIGLVKDRLFDENFIRAQETGPRRAAGGPVELMFHHINIKIVAQKVHRNYELVNYVEHLLLRSL